MTEDLDLQTLRRSLAQRLQTKAELERKIRAAQSQFETEVAPLQEEVLRLQKERLKRAAQVRMRSAKLRNAYHDAQEVYEEFRAQRPKDPPAHSSSPDEVQATYRRATKRCHPDAVADSYHEEAAATFQALESAYAADQPEAVRAIAEALDTWGFPKAPTAPVASSRARAKADLQQAVSDIEESIERLHASETYQMFVELGEEDVESVVEARKRTLRERLVELKQQTRGRA